MKRIIALAAMAVAALTTTLVAASPAAAAGSCTTTFGVPDKKYNNGALVYIPALSKSLAGTNCVMSVGSYGFPVLNLQQHLNLCYGPDGDIANLFPALATDSDFGTKTRDALKAVQRYLNETENLSLVVDGVWGRNTRNEMWFWSIDSVDCVYVPAV